MENTENDTDSTARALDQAEADLRETAEEVFSLKRDLARKDVQIERLKTLLGHYGMDDGLIEIFLTL